jgi:hypothetical protein
VILKREQQSLPQLKQQQLRVRKLIKWVLHKLQEPVSDAIKQAAIDEVWLVVG